MEETKHQLEYFTRKVNSDPGVIESWIELINFNINEGNYDKALEICSDALLINTSTSLICKKAEIYSLLGEITLAIDVIEEGLKTYPNDCSLLTKMAVLKWERNDDIDEIEKYFLEALNENPEYVDAVYGLGVCYVAKDMFSEAINLFRFVVNRQKENENAWYNLGSCFYIIERYFDAQRCFSIAYKLNPNTYRNKLYLGYCKMNLNKKIDAISIFEEMSIQFPTEIPHQINLALLYQQNGNYKEAKKIFNRTNDLKPNDIDILGYIALLEMETLKIDSAIFLLRKALRLNPEIRIEIPYKFYLGFCYFNLNDRENALFYYDEAIRLSKEMEPYTNEYIQMYGLKYLKSVNVDKDKLDLFKSINRLFEEVEPSKN